MHNPGCQCTTCRQTAYYRPKPKPAEPKPTNPPANGGPVNSITVVGNLTRDPELRYTNAQKPMCTFSVAYSTRRKDGDQWVDGDTAYFDCVAFDTLAENIAETLSKGTRTIVAGKLKQRSWDTPEGDKRSKVEIIVDACGRDLRWSDSPAGSKPAPSRPDPMDEPF